MTGANLKHRMTFASTHGPSTEALAGIKQRAMSPVTVSLTLSSYWLLPVEPDFILCKSMYLLMWLFLSSLTLSDVSKTR